jgi:hypothetical protein
MNGRTGTGEYFYQSDFQTVLNFAQSSGMTRYTFWPVNRDRSPWARAPRPCGHRRPGNLDDPGLHGARLLENLGHRDTQRRLSRRRARDSMTGV